MLQRRIGSSAAVEPCTWSNANVELLMLPAVVHSRILSAHLQCGAVEELA